MVAGAAVACGDPADGPDATPDAAPFDGGPAPDASAVDAPLPDGSAPMLEVTSFTEETWTWDQTVDACAFANMGNPFWDWLMVGREPVAAGAYPVFLYLPGTGDVADNPVAVSVVESMASRGFVAASIAYDSLSGLGAILDDPAQACPILDKKADCLFGAGEGSAIALLCARDQADCGRGIVLAGHSQGSALAIAAADHDDRVRAAWGLSGGIHTEINAGIVVRADSSACAPPAARALPADRLRLVNGESEQLLGDSLQQDVRDLTGIDCPLGTLECLRPDGSGWTFFPDAANEDGRGVSQHCYMVNSPAGDCTASTGLNSTWTDGTASYAREPSLTWLASHTTR
jgi:pimeloyl-ACP methyl ester carboxylesterase